MRITEGERCVAQMSVARECRCLIVFAEGRGVGHGGGVRYACVDGLAHTRDSSSFHQVSS